MTMKSFRINLDSRFFVMTKVSSIGKGRPRKGALRKKSGSFEIESLPEKLYLEVANLKNEDIDKFIRKYQFALFKTGGDNNLAIAKDIIQFKKELKQIINGSREIKKAFKSERALTEHFLVKRGGDFFSIVNKYLVSCHLGFNLPPMISRELSSDDLSSYAEEIKNMEPESSGHLKNPVFFTYGPSKNFPNLSCRCDDVRSWCVLNLVVDLFLKEEPLRFCLNCGRLFSPVHLGTEYCSDPDCQILRERKRKQKSRQK